MKRGLAVFFLFTFLVCALCGCTPTLTGVDNLMRPPKLSGENTGIEEAFSRATANRSIKMKTPTTGEYRSAYVLKDIDGDAEEEVITFYCNADDETAVYMHILDRVEERWETVADIKGKGSEVDKIDFCDMNGDGVSEIVVCWSLFESSGSKVMTVYTAAFGKNTGTVRELASEPFSQMVHIDMNADENDDILLVLLTSENGKNRTVAKLLMMDSDFGIYCPGSVELIPALRVSSLQSQKADRADNLQALVYADCVLNETTAVTEIIYWDAQASRLCAPLTADNASDTPKTARAVHLSVADIEKDGRLDIPTAKPLENAVTVNSSDEQPLELTTWLQFDGESLQVKTQGLMINSSSYMFRLSEAEAENMAIVNNIPDRTCTFYARSADGARGQALFQLVVFPATERTRRRPTEYVTLTESSTLTYNYRITEYGTQTGVDSAYLETHFVLIQ